MAAPIKRFDVRLVSKHFLESKTDDGDIKLQEYILGYREWCKFFSHFGTIFSFVTSDINTKLSILEEYKAGDDAAYATVQSMIKHEKTNGILDQELSGKSKGASGARTLLRLHRALKFCYKLIEDAIAMDDNGKMSTTAWNAYQETLANHHTWIIRKGVGVAVYTLPTKKKLFEKVGGESGSEGESLMQDAVNSIKPVYDIVQDEYDKNGILDLP